MVNYFNYYLHILEPIVIPLVAGRYDCIVLLDLDQYNIRDGIFRWDGKMMTSFHELIMLFSPHIIQKECNVIKRLQELHLTTQEKLMLTGILCMSLGMYHAIVCYNR